MKLAPKISLSIHTASRDDFLRNEGIISHAAMVVDAIDRLRFPKDEMELIYVDRYYEEQPKLFDILRPRFVVKHVAVHPDHRYWYDKGYCYISAAKNTALLYADGQHFVTCDDAEVFNTDDFLDFYWNYAEKGLFLNAGYCRWRHILTHNGLPVYPLQGRQEINDSRNFHGHVFEHNEGSWLYAGTSFPLEVGLQLNGFNERMDGTKGLEDADFGVRMSLAGFKFVMDRSVYVHILEHANDYKRNDLIAVENFGVLRWAPELGQIEANKHAITEAHLSVVQKWTKHYRYFCPLAPENAEKLKIWLATPTFDLRQQRDELRQSQLWRW